MSSKPRFSMLCLITNGKKQTELFDDLRYIFTYTILFSDFYDIIFFKQDVTFY